LRRLDGYGFAAPPTVSALRSRTGMPPSRLPSTWCSSGYSN